MDSTTDLQQIRDRIKTQYETMTGQKLDLTDAQIQTIIGTHLLPGELGKLIPAELKAKVKLLTTTIPDEGVRRFLLEGGFCGKWDIPSMIKNMHYKTKINDDFEYNYFKNQLEKYK
ncbi:MAG: hypothetical protein H6766_04400 [Candidatus Peribacteria bacterium]|nr:MAG: hypothetical protein H6766_04400 [Candidatus Peribacteria bacterium]